MSSFFSDQESETLISAIAKLEHETIGEIRIHIEDLCPIEPYDRAIEVFNKLEMYRTKSQTGILIYISTEDKKIAVIGDKGIHDKLGSQYWTEILVKMKELFQSTSIFAGVELGLREVGAQLVKHFPEKRTPDNELSNDISYGQI